MKLRIFAIYDDKAEAFMNLFELHHDGEATRFVQDLIENPRSPYASHVEDYELFRIGEYDTSSGLVTAVTPVVSICAAAQSDEALRGEGVELGLWPAPAAAAAAAVEPAGKPAEKAPGGV